ncbi:MAG: hypothetical protein ACUVT5_00875 [Candidatus Bathyarchaeales archaeon]
MQPEASRLFASMRFLVPRNNFWLKRLCILFAFILMDYGVTLALCKTPAEEGNLFARSFMETYGIPLGLTLFDFIANFPIYLLLCLNSHIVDLPSRFSKIAESFVDLTFAWFIAGLHFNGAASWFWFAPDVLRQFSGAFLYLLIILIISLKKP